MAEFAIEFLSLHFHWLRQLYCTGEKLKIISGVRDARAASLECRQKLTRSRTD
jgi:hypothetical protein